MNHDVTTLAMRDHRVQITAICFIKFYVVWQVSELPSDEIVHADNLMAGSQKLISYMTCKKASDTRNKTLQILVPSNIKPKEYLVDVSANGLK